MQLFFTGADVYQGSQKDPENSLGGFVASTPIPNNRVNGLFTEVSSYAQANELSEIIGIALINTTSSDKANVKLTQIYSNLFDKDNNQCTFQWAAVTLVNNQKMERIESNLGEPFYGDFFDITSRKADGVLKITSGAEEGDIVTVLGNTTDPIMGGSIENVVDAIILEFIGNTSYTVLKKSATEVYFQRNTIGTNTDPIVLTSMSVTAVNTAFSNGFDGTVLLATSLPVNSGLGLWIKRTVKKKVIETSDELLADSFLDPIILERLMVTLSWD